jgi:hypothetical protein
MGNPLGNGEGFECEFSYLTKWVFSYVNQSRLNLKTYVTSHMNVQLSLDESYAIVTW